MSENFEPIIVDVTVTIMKNKYSYNTDTEKVERTLRLEVLPSMLRVMSIVQSMAESLFSECVLRYEALQRKAEDEHVQN
jgi:hypothetical protein